MVQAGLSGDPSFMERGLSPCLGWRDVYHPSRRTPGGVGWVFPLYLLSIFMFLFIFSILFLFLFSFIFHISLLFLIFLFSIFYFYFFLFIFSSFYIFFFLFLYFLSVNVCLLSINFSPKWIFVSPQWESFPLQIISSQWIVVLL
jgi:hypothetical protein